MFLALLFSQSALAGAVSGLLEGMGIPWPGEIILGAIGTEFSGVMAALVIGTIFSVTYTISSVAQYFLGRSFWHLMKRFLTPEVQEKMDSTMRRYGQLAVMWTRPFLVGNYISIPAGIMRMPMGKFLLYTFIGIWPWAFCVILAGSVLGTYVDPIAKFLPYVAGAMVLWVLWSGWRKLWRQIQEARKESASDQL